MALVLGDLYVALRQAGASEERAMAAAAEAAGYRHRKDFRATADQMSSIDECFAELDDCFARIQRRMRLHTWLLASNAAMLIVLLLRLSWP